MSQDAPRVSFNRDDILFEEGQTGDTAYVLVQGGVDLVKKGRAAGRCFVAEHVTQPGTAFGMVPLIDKGPRMMSAIVTKPSTVCELITAQDLRKRIGEASPFVRNLMRVLTFRLRATTDRLAQDARSIFDDQIIEDHAVDGTQHMELATFAKGDILFKEGDVAGVAFLLESGSVELSLPGLMGRASAELIETPGMLFGFAPLLDGAAQIKTARAVRDTKCRIITQDQFKACMNDNDPVVDQTITQLVKHLRKMTKQLAAGGITTY